MKTVRDRRRVAPPPAALLQLLAVGAAALSPGTTRAQEPGQQPGQEPPHGPPAPTAPAEPPAPPKQAATTPLIRGQLTTRYLLRWTGNQNDSDLYETLTLDVGDPDKHDVTGHFYGRLAADLDADTNGSPPFFSLQDVRSHDVDAYVYDAFADVHSIEALELLRIGRQTIAETPELAFFDGVHARTSGRSDSGLQFGAYGGVSVHLYESSHSGDVTAGLYGEGRPWNGGRIRLDWMHLEDEALLGSHNDDLFSGGIWQTFERLQLEGQYSRIEGRNRDVRARAAYAEPESRFQGQVTWYQLLTTQRSQVLELDPFFNALQELFPYWQLSGMVGKGVTQNVEVDVGADVRRVVNRADLGTFNRDYERWYLNVNLRDVWVEGLTLTATADYWNSDEQDVHTWAGELSQRCSQLVTFSAGSYYSMYKFSLFSNAERDHVRTYYGRLRWSASRATELDLAYEFEQTDLDDFQVLRMGFTWRF